MSEVRKPQQPHLDEVNFDETINGDRRPISTHRHANSHHTSPIPSSGFSEADSLVIGAPYNPEAYDPEEIESCIASAVHHDVEHEETEDLLKPAFATERALDAYDLYVSDTNYKPEDAVVHYLHELSRLLCTEEAPEVSQADVDKFIEDVEAFLRDLDYEASVHNHHPVTT